MNYLLSRKELSKTQKNFSESKKLIAAQVAQIGELNTEIEGLQKEMTRMIVTPHYFFPEG